ncbi:MAG TPA: hypothetical protein VIR01_04915, partial [Pyrinomonadaceae bacterium]
ELLRPRGTLVLKSTFHGPGKIDEIDQARLVVDEITILGSRCGRFQPALDLLKKGAIDIDSLISEEYPLAEGVYAMERAGGKGVLKVLLRPWAFSICHLTFLICHFEPRLEWLESVDAFSN